MTTNLKELVKHASTLPMDIESENRLVGRRIRHKFTDRIDGVDTETWYTGKIISQVIIKEHPKIYCTKTLSPTPAIIL